MRVWAIGDIHGRSDLLAAMLGAIARYDDAPLVVFLGDLIDRGPDSCGVLDLIVSHLQDHPQSRLILGNHDWFLRQFLSGTLDDPQRQRWLGRFGGTGALASYGIKNAQTDWQSAREAIFLQRPHHRHLLEQASHSLVIDGNCFVHAGLRPGIALERQSETDLMWIKDEFLECKESFGYFIVHGHSPTSSGRPEIYPNRLALDTKAFASGVLSAALFIDGELSTILCTCPEQPGADAVSRLDISRLERFHAQT